MKERPTAWTAFESELSSQLPFMELLSSGEFP